MLENKIGHALGHDALGARDSHSVGQLIRPAVVSAAHFQNIFLPCFQPGDPGGAHGGLCSRPQHPEHLHRGHQIGDLFRQLILILVEQSRGRAAGIQQIDHLFPHFRHIAAQDGGTSGLKQIVIPIAVNIPQFCPFRLCDDDGEGVIEGQVVLHPAGDHLLCLGDHLLGLGTFCVKIVLDVVRQFVPPDRPDGLGNQLIQLRRHLFRVQIFVDCETAVSHLAASLLY